MEGLVDTQAALSTSRILGVLGHAWDDGEERAVRGRDAVRATPPKTEPLLRL